MAVNPLDIWNDWSTQVLVLSSLAVQLVLLLFAGIRRREAPMVPKFILWVAYQLADSTAIYTVGQLSLGDAADRHQLAAFWAPFLLLHLGGPDNITAYALQDNELWHRHLLTLIVQVLGTAYVLYKHIINNGFLILVATTLMSVVGVVKYGEKICALRCGNLDYIRSSLKKLPLAMHNHFHPHDHGLNEEEFELRRAHSLFHICTSAIGDSSVDFNKDDLENGIHRNQVQEMWLLMEMELSLMYDILYTKAVVAHTWFGYCIRFISPVAVSASLLLFHFSGKDRHSRIDVAITYVLLAGALFMETTGLLNTLASTWTFAFLYGTRWSWLKYMLLCSGRWDRLRHVVLSLQQHVWRRIACRGSPLTRTRRWSGTMGQYNMLHYCSRRGKPAGPLLGMLAGMLGYKELWDRKHYAGETRISDEIRTAVTEYLKWLSKKSRVNRVGVIRKKWSKEALEKCKLDPKHFYVGVEFQEGIIIWHMATDIFLAQFKLSNGYEYEKNEDVKAVRVLSNYMMFLLVERPYMLPGLAQTRLYQQTCKELVKIRDYHLKDFRNTFGSLFRMHDDPINSSYLSQKQTEELASILHGKEFSSRYGASRLINAADNAKQLLAVMEFSWSKKVDVLLDVWTDMLVYAANRCSKESHAKKLNDGGELVTIVWLMIEHLHKLSHDEK